jgi:2,3-dihydroxybenzoate decarboxylase
MVNAITEMGAERVLFSVDWPFEAVEEAANWFDNAEMSDEDRAKVGRINAINLFRLKL